MWDEYPGQFFFGNVENISNIWVVDICPANLDFPSLFILSIYSMDILIIVSNYSSWLEYKNGEIIKFKTQAIVSLSDV